MSADHSTCFRSEYEQELELWFRRRFGILCVAYLVFEAARFGWLLLTLIGALGEAARNRGHLGLALTQTTAVLVTLAVFFTFQRCASCSRQKTLRRATAMILVLGSISIGGALFSPDRQAIGNVLGSLFFWHFTASLILPWTPRESMKPLTPLLIVWAAAVLWQDPTSRTWGGALMLLTGPVILVPGIAISAWRLRRHGRHFHIRMVGKHFISMRQELSRARAIHESMFPMRYDDEHVRFEYTYTPMRELGGDYIHLHVTDDGLVHLCVLDVTGHGLAAALTVNRVYGELERIHAEMPEVTPGEVLALLNRYFFLTLARHQIYATAACFRVDPNLGRLTWANAGHPPAFVRGANRSVTQLAATTVILGALPDDEFDAADHEMDLTPGDVLVAYTDGAFEARDRAGAQFGIEQIRAMMAIQPPPRNLPQFIAAAVERHIGGPADDDVLICSLHFLEPRRAAVLHTEAVGEEVSLAFHSAGTQ